MRELNDELHARELETMSEVGPTNWALETLLRIGAWGLHRDNEETIRVLAVEAKRRYEEADGA